MDFYHIEKPGKKINVQKYPNIRNYILDKIIELENGHYIRIKNNINWQAIETDLFEPNTMKKVERDNISDSIIAWSTNNTVIQKSTTKNGKILRGNEDIKKMILDYENSIKR